MVSIRLFEIFPGGAGRLYSAAVDFADEGAAPHGFRKRVYRAPARGSHDYAPIAPTTALLKLLDDGGAVLLEERIAFPAIRNPSARASREGFLAPVDAAAARGTPFEAAAREFALLPKRWTFALGATEGTKCTAKLTFQRAAEPPWVHSNAATGDVYCYELARATVWTR